MSKQNQVVEQESKEFQMKLIWPAPGVKPAATPEEVDRQLFAIARDAIVAAVEAVADGRKTSFEFSATGWHRRGIRYDTAERSLKAACLTLAVEATDARTKLKCKAHQFVPELLFDKNGDSICWPDADSVSGKQGKTQFKLEQDLHFDNMKYCASGSLYLKGSRTDASDIGFFSEHFPGLKKRWPAATPLVTLSDWDETVFDSMRVSWGRQTVDSWMLVNRRPWGGSELIESELSFKFEKAPDDAWDVRELEKLSALYLALQQTGAFQPAPPIFFYNNPVSSVGIKVVGK